ncbi:MAG: hypothetical protein GC134_08940 [Proteobacteria bacterium]|nr:hypothetical protein [Pseudomonadota bacterium]
MRFAPLPVLLCAVYVSALMAGCATYVPYPPQPAPALPDMAGYYTVRPYQQPKSYVSSYVEASKPEGSAQEWQQPVGYVSSYVRAYHEDERADLKALEKESLNDLWDTPDAAPKPAMLMRDPELRSRLNTALESNKDGIAWQYGEARYSFEPNTPPYIARATGERCRDGVLVRSTPYNSERMRGLFCQKSAGADWMLVR